VLITTIIQVIVWSWMGLFIFRSFVTRYKPKVK
jgi:hypothetical protein